MVLFRLHKGDGSMTEKKRSTVLTILRGYKEDKEQPLGTIEAGR